jgi:hypothetical protein
MTLDLTEEETAALAQLLSNTIDADHYPLSPRIQLLKGILAKIRPEATPRTAPAAEALRAAARWTIPQARLVKSEFGPPMTLGSAAAAHVRLIG